MAAQSGVHTHHNTPDIPADPQLPLLNGCVQTGRVLAGPEGNLFLTNLHEQVLVRIRHVVVHPTGGDGDVAAQVTLPLVPPPRPPLLLLRLVSAQQQKPLGYADHHTVKFEPAAVIHVVCFILHA